MALEGEGQLQVLVVLSQGEAQGASGDEGVVDGLVHDARDDVHRDVLREEAKAVLLEYGKRGGLIYNAGQE